jgi:hypothetical protein
MVSTLEGIRFHIDCSSDVEEEEKRPANYSKSAGSIRTTDLSDRSGA